MARRGWPTWRSSLPDWRYRDPLNWPLWRAPVGLTLLHVEAARHGRDVAGVIAPPPVLFGIGFLASLGLQRLLPLPLQARQAGWLLPVGLVLGGAGVLISTWMVIAFRRGRTSLSPLHPTTRLVRSGPYQFSRNPDYIGQTLLFVGLILMLNTWWGLILVPPILFTINRGVIAREERYLEAKFGDEYARYKNRVRRWL